MIRCISFINGRPIFGSSGSKKLKQCRTLLCRIRLSKDLSGQSEENTWIRHYFGRPSIWEQKLGVFQQYFNRERVHSGLDGKLPDPDAAVTPLKFDSYRWQQHCRGLYQTPVAA